MEPVPIPGGAVSGVSESPAEHRQRILALLETDRYNQEILGELIACLHSQIENDWYDCEINLAILKLYQFHPEEENVNLDVVLKILVKALMNLPDHDLQLCLYVLPEPYQSLEEVANLSALAEKLERAQYKDFWKLLEEKKQLLAIVPGLERTMRRFILETVSLTYSVIPRKVLCDVLNVADSDLQTLFDAESLKSEGLVKLEGNEENQPKEKSVEKESHLTLHQISPLMSNLM
mmetsp:Transcript_26710/g.32383  ORF Transcript_26710/g.32383 Transcript_26710/m.32383 type:complete len:234 (+) Transcript_26710:187-888(+)|eukprot:CAMPEP_0204826518 /NCGR_PEP_ID=MMETSP1346-20131115/4193_1 /ASSEMBLY_ACC=CAM_ASM_000771 /TAXON_ID=215587 /ORGANISM="Aplanochytrium stocchinoi, Strain GSBS06" /LENGTH=233 /DNA_ID=CAMNT_0051954583 /DNA_START=81 /DNA_END=782 /DNA_ORIENTATION=-